MNLKKSATIPTTGLIKQYERAFEQHGDSAASVLWPRGRQDLRFEALTRHFQNSKFSLLDYGCGLCHLKEYLDKRFSNYEYIGADIVPGFTKTVQSKYPTSRARLVNSPFELTEMVDHVVISGVFNMVLDMKRDDYLNYVKQTIMHLFSICRVSLSVNFMTDRVDFMQLDAHHVNVESMYIFIRDKLSPRLVLDQSYMPYEFNFVVYQDQYIDRTKNTYKE